MLLISSVAQLAIATIHVQEVIIPQSLIDTATIFHGKSSKKKLSFSSFITGVEL